MNNKLEFFTKRYYNFPQYKLLKTLIERHTLFDKFVGRVLANYMIWRLVTQCVNFLTDQLRKRELEFLTEQSGKTEREPRWKECVGISSDRFSLAIGSLYVKQFFDERAKKEALEMVDGIRKEMFKILSSNDWMDDETR